MSPEEPAPAAPTTRRSVLDRHRGNGTEIERKFLVTQLPADLDQHPSERIAQGYLAIDADAGAEVRLRRRGFHTLLTVKQGSGLSRAEEEFVIDSPRFERLWAGTQGRRVEKTRYRIPAGPFAGTEAHEGGPELIIEVDVFTGALAGFVMAEVEFPSVEASEAFQPPSWLRPEVTGDKRYGNARLAVDGAPDRKAVGEHALLDGEPVADGVRHVALAQIDAAADALQGRDAEEYGKAVHTARKAFKRARALVRIARDGLAEGVAERENAALREAGQRLAGARDALVVVETLDAVAERYPDELHRQQIGGLREALLSDYEAADAEARGDAGAVDEVLEILEGLRVDVAAWQLGPDAAGTLAAGLDRILAHGRKRLKLVKKNDSGDGEYDTELLHEMRKRAKDLWHAAELVEIAAPKRFKALASDAHDLADLIGDDHDLSVLVEQVEQRPGVFADPADADLLLALIEKRRRKLQRRAVRLAEAIFGTKPSRFIERVQEIEAG